jgi:hypothetical protein
MECRCSRGGGLRRPSRRQRRPVRPSKPGALLTEVQAGCRRVATCLRCEKASGESNCGSSHSRRCYRCRNRSSQRHKVSPPREPQRASVAEGRLHARPAGDALDPFSAAQSSRVRLRCESSGILPGLANVRPTADQFALVNAQLWCASPASLDFSSLYAKGFPADASRPDKSARSR